MGSRNLLISQVVVTVGIRCTQGTGKLWPKGYQSQWGVNNKIGKTLMIVFQKT